MTNDVEKFVTISPEAMALVEEVMREHPVQFLRVALKLHGELCGVAESVPYVKPTHPAKKAAAPTQAKAEARTPTVAGASKAAQTIGLYESGMRDRVEIARLVGSTVAAVGWVIGNRNTERIKQRVANSAEGTSRVRRYHKVPDELRRSVEEAYLSGDGLAEITTKYPEAGSDTIRKILKEAGLVRPGFSARRARGEEEGDFRSRRPNTVLSPKVGALEEVPVTRAYRP